MRRSPPRFSFYPNLRASTYRRGSGNPRFDSYLISRDFLRSLRKLAESALADGARLMLDNGLFGDAEDLEADAASGESAALERGAVWRAEREREALPPLAAQEVVGAEDLWSALLVRRGLPLDGAWPVRLDEVAGWSRAWSDKLGSAVDVFVPVHARSFDDARTAGRVLGKHGLAVALSLTWAMKLRGNTTRVELAAPLTWASGAPRLYVDAIVPLLGVIEGYREVAGRAPRVHTLGLGTPIMLPMVAGAACSVGGVLTTDSMAPIDDAERVPELSLYVHTPGPAKYKVAKIAEAWVKDGVPWGCACPFCKACDKAYPPSPERARRRFEQTGVLPDKYGLMSDGAYAADFPLLARFSGDSAKARATRTARTNHNLWVLRRIEQRIREAGEGLRGWVGDMVARHGERADPAYAEAARRGWQAVETWLAASGAR